MQERSRRLRQSTLFDHTPKRCRKCGEVKHKIDFYKNRSDCIDCNKASKREWYRQPENRRRAIERAQEWRRKNPDRYLESLRLYRELNRERIRRRERDRYLERTYGISLARYESLSESQNHLCAICGSEEIGGLHVDHDHRTSKVRGLLWGRCNKAIGLLDEDPYNLRAAEEYLARTLHVDEESRR